jgi:hypothetical protein
VENVASFQTDWLDVPLVVTKLFKLDFADLRRPSLDLVDELSLVLSEEAANPGASSFDRHDLALISIAAEAQVALVLTAALQ